MSDIETLANDIQTFFGKDFLIRKRNYGYCRVVWDWTVDKWSTIVFDGKCSDRKYHDSIEKALESLPDSIISFIREVIDLDGILEESCNNASFFKSSDDPMLYCELSYPTVIRLFQRDRKRLHKRLTALERIKGAMPGGSDYEEARSHFEQQAGIQNVDTESDAVL